MAPAASTHGRLMPWRNQRVDVEIVSWLSALLHNGTLVPGMSSREATRTFEPSAICSDAASPRPRLPKNETNTSPPRSTRRVEVWLTTCTCSAPADMEFRGRVLRARTLAREKNEIERLSMTKAQRHRPLVVKREMVRCRVELRPQCALRRRQYVEPWLEPRHVASSPRASGRIAQKHVRCGQQRGATFRFSRPAKTARRTAKARLRVRFRSDRPECARRLSHPASKKELRRCAAAYATKPAGTGSLQSERWSHRSRALPVREAPQD